MMNIHRIAGLFLIGLLLTSSCAALGSKRRIYNSDTLSKISRVVILPPMINSSYFTDDTKVSFQIYLDSILPSAISSKTNWKIRFSDSMETSRYSQDISEEQKMDLTYDYDALIFPTLKIINPSREPNIVIELKIKSPHNTDVADVKYSTALGNSYWGRPSYPKLIDDAVAGVVKMLNEQ